MTEVPPSGSDPAQPVVRAAGGVVHRPASAPRGGAGIEVLLVHRPRYDDWTFPKGKCDPGESFRDAAVREVEEETGLRCELGPSLGEIGYVDHKGRPKVVRYWAMTVEGGSGEEFVANDEVDLVEWLPVDEAENRLTYAYDVDVLRSLPPG